MNTIFMFGSLDDKKRSPMEVYKKGNRNFFTPSVEPSIVCSQHEYDFVPTTQRQIII